jgi:hypothetical protein
MHPATKTGFGRRVLDGSHRAFKTVRAV